MITLSNVRDFVKLDVWTCAAPNDRALVIYRRCVTAGLIQEGDVIHVRGDIDDALNSDDWQQHISILKPIEVIAIGKPRGASYAAWRNRA